MNENKASDQNLDENVYIDIALELISMFKGEMPSDDAISDRADNAQVNADSLKEWVNREFKNLQKIKKSLDSSIEREPMKRNEVAFEEIHRFLYDLMSDAIHVCGGYSESLSHIEERLTIHEFLTLEAFYKWVETGGMKGNAPFLIPIRGFGGISYNERYKEWLATLEEKK